MSPVISSPALWSADARVLLFGAGGFLGARLARALVDAGAAVIGVDRTASTPCWRVAEAMAPMLCRDGAQFDNVLMTVRDAQPNVVFNLMGQSHIAAAQADPLGAFAANVTATWNVLEACRRYQEDGGRLSAIVVSSSNHVYGSLRDHDRAAGVPGILILAENAWRERDALEPADVYGASKGCADLITRAYARGYGLPAIALRHANAFGPGDPHASHLVTGAVLSILANEAPRLRGDGSARKDYLYVDDVIAAYLRAAELAGSGVRADALNAAPDVSMGALEMLQRLVTASGHPELIPVVGASDEQRGSTEHLNSTTFRRLGWALQWRLDDALRATYEWYVKRGGMTWAT